MVLLILGDRSLSVGWSQYRRREIPAQDIRRGNFHRIIANNMNSNNGGVYLIELSVPFVDNEGYVVNEAG